MKKKIITIIAGMFILAGITTIAMSFVDDSTEKTDDAQIEQYLSPVNVKVPGYIKEIRFTEHQYVHKGDTLMIIDDREYAIALQLAEAALIDAQSGKKVVGNTVNTASTSAAVFESTIEEAGLRVEKLQRDYDRYSRLLERKATTPVVVEQYRTELDMAKARVSALRQQREAARSAVSEVNQRRENADAAIYARPGRCRYGTAQPVVYGYNGTYRRVPRTQGYRGRTACQSRPDNNHAHA